MLTARHRREEPTLTRVSTLNLAIGWTAFGLMTVIGLAVHVSRAFH
jgi:hypothetical protein